MTSRSHVVEQRGPRSQYRSARGPAPGRAASSRPPLSSPPRSPPLTVRVIWQQVIFFSSRKNLVLFGYLSPSPHRYCYYGKDGRVRKHPISPRGPSTPLPSALSSLSPFFGSLSQQGGGETLQATVLLSASVLARFRVVGILAVNHIY